MNKKTKYQPHFTNPKDLEEIERLMEKYSTENARLAISSELANRRDEGADSGNEAQREVQAGEDTISTRAKLVELQTRLECEIENEGYGPNYLIKLCELLYRVGEEYPDLRKIMVVAETEIIASNISPP